MCTKKVVSSYIKSLLTTTCILAPSLVFAQSLTAFDGFESGNLNYVAKTDNGVTFFKWGPSAYAKVSSEKAKTGKYSLQFNYQAAVEGKDSWAEQRFLIPNVMANTYEFNYDLYVPDNFTQRTETSSSNNKFFVLWSGSYGTLASLQSVAFEYWPVGELEKAYGWWSNSFASQNIGSSVLDYHLGPGHTDWGHKFATHNFIFSPSDAGKWINIDIYIKLASSKNSSDGEIRIKKNGSIYYDVKNIANYSELGNYLDHGYILGWSNSGFANSTVMYVDNFRVTVSGFPPSSPRLQVQ